MARDDELRYDLRKSDPEKWAVRPEAPLTNLVFDSKLHAVLPDQSLRVLKMPVGKEKILKSQGELHVAEMSCSATIRVELLWKLVR